MTLTKAQRRALQDLENGETYGNRARRALLARLAERDLVFWDPGTPNDDPMAPTGARYRVTDLGRAELAK